jgi:hypothetical protein
VLSPKELALTNGAQSSNGSGVGLVKPAPVDAVEVPEEPGTEA